MLIKAMIISAILTLPPPPLDGPRAKPLYYTAVVEGWRKDTPKTKAAHRRKETAASGKHRLPAAQRVLAPDSKSGQPHPAPMTLAGQDRGKSGQ